MNLFADNGHQPLPAEHIDHDDLAGLEADLLLAVKGKELFEEKLRSFFRSAIDEVIDTARSHWTTLRFVAGKRRRLYLRRRLGPRKAAIFTRRRE